MKETTFFVIVGILAAVSLTSGFLGWHYAKRQEKKDKHIDGSSYREVYEDNEPVNHYSRTNRELAEEYAHDCGCIDYPY